MTDCLSIDAIDDQEVVSVFFEEPNGCTRCADHEVLVYILAVIARPAVVALGSVGDAGGGLGDRAGAEVSVERICVGITVNG